MKSTKLTARVLWVAFGVLIASWFVFRPDRMFLLDSHPNIICAFAALSGLALLYYLYIAVCACFYRPARPLTDAELPGCTVIVPAYNEGRHVAETLESLLAADFPHDKLEIIAINDGSKDDTMRWIQSVADRAGGKIVPVDLPFNQGKKHALYQGIQMARYDVIVTVDSDSTVEPCGLRNIVSPFAQPDVGGVAGNIRIKNLADGALPKMMDVGFMFGFEVIRCAQSLIGYVMCTPGALSAYRKSLILPFLEEWMHQTFMGAPATIGEDRAITTMILRHNYRVVFQRDAVAHTCIPHTFGRFSKMLIRWTRSDIRENGIVWMHAFGHFEFSHRQIGRQIHVAMQWVNTILPALFPLLVLAVLFCAPSEFPFYFYASLTMGSIAALIPAFIYARRVSALESVWGMSFAVYSVVALSWIPLYSILTVRNSKWLTRELPQKKTRRVQINRNCKMEIS